MLLIDSGGALLMWHDSDPGAPGRPAFWCTTGGGVDPGETDRLAARREVREETGLDLSDRDLTGPVAERQVVHGYSDSVVTQQEVYFAVRCERFEPDTSEHTLDEQATFNGHRWWTIEELERTRELLFPAGVAGLLVAATARLAGPRGGATVASVALPVAQESTVDAGATTPDAEGVFT